jgi:hypothetical protein
MLTHFAAVSRILDMLAAISTTEVLILLRSGFRSLAHEARTDWSMFLGSIFLLVVRAGAWSFDAILGRKGRS